VVCEIDFILAQLAHTRQEVHWLTQFFSYLGNRYLLYQMTRQSRYTPNQLLTKLESYVTMKTISVETMA